MFEFGFLGVWRLSKLVKWVLCVPLMTKRLTWSSCSDRSAICIGARLQRWLLVGGEDGDGEECEWRRIFERGSRHWPPSLHDLEGRPTFSVGLFSLAST